MKISAVIITFNEEKNIERCLKSLTEIADEIIVVDSFSTDKTEEICKNYKTTFIKHKFDGHIQQKNWAKEQANFNYVLSLDADETVSSELKNSILNLKKQKNLADAYYFNRRTNYCGKWINHSGWYPDKKLRLWNTSKGKWGGENPHDKFIIEKGATEQHLFGDLYHYSYYSISEHSLQTNKFTDINAQVLFDKGKQTNLLQIILKPTWKFFRNYFIKLGILDGYYGFVVCAITAHGTFQKYIKLKELIDNSKSK